MSTLTIHQVRNYIIVTPNVMPLIYFFFKYRKKCLYLVCFANDEYCFWLFLIMNVTVYYMNTYIIWLLLIFSCSKSYLKDSLYVYMTVIAFYEERWNSNQSDMKLSFWLKWQVMFYVFKCENYYPLKRLQSTDDWPMHFNEGQK